MKSKLLLVLGCLISASLHAQSDEVGETVQLSPFEISSSYDKGYVSDRLRAPLPSEPSKPTVPVTLIKHADAVVVEFAFSNSADKQDVRNKQLEASIAAVTAAVKAVPGLKLEHRQVQLTSGDRRGSFIGKGGVVTSFANIAILGELSTDMRLYERVKQIKDAVHGARLDGDTKIIDGPAGLFLRRPNDYRAELLTKIFADIETVKKGLGADFEVLTTGLSQAVRMRACSETELELWIDYGFSIRSIREIQAKKDAK